jgi:uncharacterized coiled-coil protein SlyX
MSIVFWFSVYFFIILDIVGYDSDILVLLKPLAGSENGSEYFSGFGTPSQGQFIMGESLKSRIRQIISEQCAGSVAGFAEKIGAGESTVNTWNNGQIPKGSFLKRIHSLFSVNINWLLTGEGEPYIIDKDKAGASTREEITIYKDGNEAAEDGFKVSGALTMAARVLESGTSYAMALYTNIQHFDRAIQAEARITELEKKDEAQTDRINHLEGECETLRKRLEALEARIASQAKEEEDALPAAAENK